MTRFSQPKVELDSAILKKLWRGSTQSRFIHGAASKTSLSIRFCKGCQRMSRFYYAKEKEQHSG